MPGFLEGKTVIITGAGRGIGRAHALAMAAEGANVVVNDLGVDLDGSDAKRSAADAVVREIEEQGGVASADYSDVSDDQAVAEMVENTLQRFGVLDALINNAAVEHRGSIAEHDPAHWDRIMAVNAGGTFHCIRRAAAVMRRQGRGSIINTTSGAFWEGTDGACAYSASKAAIFSLTLSLHTECHRYGITSNCIAPNATRTRMLDSWIEQLSASSAKAEEEVLAEWGIQAPENLTALPIALCSDVGQTISGHIFEVWNDQISVISPPLRSAAIQRRDESWQVAELIEALPGLLQ